MGREGEEWKVEEKSSKGGEEQKDEKGRGGGREGGRHGGKVRGTYSSDSCLLELIHFLRQ